MREVKTEMKRAVKSLDTVKSIKKFVPSFFSKAERIKEQGKKVAWCMIGIPPEILYVFDIEAEWPEQFGTLCAAKQVAADFTARAEADGYSPEICSYVRNTMGFLSRWNELGKVPPEAPYGGMAKPDMLLGSGRLCDPRYKWFQAIATHYMEIPTFICDPMSPHYNLDLSDKLVADHYLDHALESIKGLIAFLEKTTGKNLDVRKLSEALDRSQKAIELFYEVSQLRKAVPSPMGSEDYFTAIIPQQYMVGSQEAVDFFRALRDEVKYRVDHKIGVISDEKYRLMFMGIPPWFNLGIFNYIESLGAVSVIEASYYLGKPIDVQVSSPLEALAQRSWLRCQWLHQHGSEALPEICSPAVSIGTVIPSDLATEWAREYQLDGALMHATISCRASTFGQIHSRNVLNEIGIPSLIFESDMTDPRLWSDAWIKTQINAFIETLAARRERKNT
jgi:benzoyl-CoA reductase/2-hydroxyglutaryl-CoA dehydratase subunit BcrC/BadD/HgdB